MKHVIEVAGIVEVVQKNTFNVLVPRHLFLHTFPCGLDCVQLDPLNILHYKEPLVRFRLMRAYLEKNEQNLNLRFQDIAWCLQSFVTSVKFKDNIPLGN